jgi:hypothetical protein
MLAKSSENSVSKSFLRMTKLSTDDNILIGEKIDRKVPDVSGHVCDVLPDFSVSSGEKCRRSTPTNVQA